MKIKILFVASAGGHLEETLALKSLENRYNTVLITEKTENDITYWQDKCYYMHKVNRKEIKSLIIYIGIFFKSLVILLKEKPQIIISTGAMIAFPTCLLGKLMGKKIIYIETMANINSKSMTGKIVYKFADLFIVQWESMKKLYPKAVYGGKVF